MPIQRLFRIIIFMNVSSTNSPALSTVYGPTKSWRYGLSLGVDLLFVNSICSFKCIYCQLGKINLHTNERKIYVPTKKVMADLEKSSWQESDVITFSGSGEPTLALNLGEVIRSIKSYTGKPVHVLTNATTLNQEDVRMSLREAAHVSCKLDAADEHTFRMIDRPVDEITLEQIVNNIKTFRREYKGCLAIQIMLQRMHLKHLERFAKILTEIAADEVQLNVPSRAIPGTWILQARGNDPYIASKMISPKTISSEELLQTADYLREQTGLKIIHK